MISTAGHEISNLLFPKRSIPYECWFDLFEVVILQRIASPRLSEAKPEGLIFDPFVFFAEPPCHVQLPTLMGNRIHSELDAAIAYRSMSLWHVTIPSQMLKHSGYFA